MSETQPIKRTIVISVELEVTSWDDVSGLSPDELASRVYDAVLEERNELAIAARIAALRLMNGDNVSDDE
jgi:hypothetical protein